jgi:hypothetical protein
MQGRPATAALWLSVAAIADVRWSGVVRRSGFRARSSARRRSWVRFIENSFQEVIARVDSRLADRRPGFERTCGGRSVA